MCPVEDPRQGQAWTVDGLCLYNQYAMTGNVHNDMEGDWSLNDHLIIKENSCIGVGATKDAPPTSNFFIFGMQFLANSLPNNTLAHLPLGLAPLFWEILDPQLAFMFKGGGGFQPQKIPKMLQGASKTCLRWSQISYFDGRYRNEEPFLATNEMMSHYVICDVIFRVVWTVREIAVFFTRRPI